VDRWIAEGKVPSKWGFCWERRTSVSSKTDFPFLPRLRPQPCPVGLWPVMADTTSEEKKKKLSRKERERELRALTSDGRGCGFKKDLVADRHLDDQRYEREIAFKKQQQAAAAAAKRGSGGKDKAGAVIPGVTLGAPPPSAAFDALIRMEAGLGQRTIHDNINDPNRPSWEDYKKAKADKLDLVPMNGK
ncbi:hypothetical protein NGA_0461100, partial [Nannochloropsis gaditana CCMP526]|uniref:uncharacterized protein n=1 Tax=Nannochloropsis gaditana (strain CCMP526) TaxID=1093141 RepID=UPI00029F55A4